MHGRLARPFGAPAPPRWRCSFSPPRPAARCLVFFFPPFFAVLVVLPVSWLLHHAVCIVVTGMHAICIHGECIIISSTNERIEAPAHRPTSTMSRMIRSRLMIEPWRWRAKRSTSDLWNNKARGVQCRELVCGVLGFQIRSCLSVCLSEQ